MVDNKKQTEERIADAARAVFVEKGMAGARMQEIADRAGINKSLLHYYFRSKEKLFDFVCANVAGKIGKLLAGIIQEGTGIEEKVRFITGHYIELLIGNPFLPNFIVNELYRDPVMLAEKLSKAEIEPAALIITFEKQLKEEGYSIETIDFIVNCMSLVVFPFVARPILEQILFNGDSNAYEQYIKERKERLAIFIMGALEAYKTS